ncbi:MAG: NUDIX domain-containing protein [SAR202 cluster bacterium]|nr:NUDIX domain-containing protein [SAR202 cluster bacterium]
MESLAGAANAFGGFVVSPEALPTEPELFRRKLAFSIEAWRQEGYKLVWLELPISRARLVPIAADLGFSYHHAGEGYLMMTCRLVETAFIPAYATHYIGAGGVVLNDRRELLVVREKRGGKQGIPSNFKLPGGALHAGEHLVDGVIREVLEETGIKTRFQSLVSLRNQHGYRYGKSDIYFVCRLEPLSNEICKQEDEIEECRWMSVDDYLGIDSVSIFNKSIVRAAIENPGLSPRVLDGYGRDPTKIEIFFPRNPQ